MLVNTIGAFGQGDVLSTTPEQLRLMLDVNVAAALWLSQAAALAHLTRILDVELPRTGSG